MRARRPILTALAPTIALVSALIASTATAAAAPDTGSLAPATPLRLSYVSTTELPDNTTVDGVPVGGLSGIDYDAGTGSLYAISDDRGDKGPARFYTFSAGAVLNHAPLHPRQTALQGIGTAQSDTESLRLLPNGDLLVSSEADGPSDGNPGVQAFVREFTRAGRPVRDIALPPEFHSNWTTTGFRDNLGFEGMTVHDGTVNLLAESALAQDGPITTAAGGARTRLLQIQPGGRTTQFVYVTDPLAPGTTGDNGNSELLALNATDFLVIERGYNPTTGRNHVRVYWTTTNGALPINGRYPLTAPQNTIQLAMLKRLVFDFASVHTLANPDNVEGMTFGPRLPDGRQSLILVSDNNFSSKQHTYFHVLAVN